MPTFATPGHVQLDVELASGEIALETFEGTETHVELESGRDDERGREAVAATRIDLRELAPDRHEVRVHAPYTRSFGFWRDPGLRLRVRCPHGTAVAVRTTSADMEARGRFGDVQVQGASSDLHLERVEGSFRSKTASGDVEVGVVTGSAEVSTASGDIRIGQALGTVSASLVSGDLTVFEARAGAGTRSVSGDQRVAGIVEGAVEANSVSGDIEIGICQGSRVRVEASSLSGDLLSELSLGDAPVEGDGPAVDVRGRTVSGDFRIVRSPAGERAA